MIGSCTLHERKYDVLAAQSIMSAVPSAKYAVNTKDIGKTKSRTIGAKEQDLGFLIQVHETLLDTGALPWYQ